VIAPRWRKVLRDIFLYSGRSLLAVIAMAAGVFEIGALLYKYAVLQPVLHTMYGRTHPASATLVTDRVDDDLVEVVRRVPGVADAEARPVVMARVRVGPDEWRPAALSVIRDFDRQRIDTFTPEEGVWPPKEGQVLLERSALSVARVGIGDSIVVRTPDGATRALQVAGTVHAPGLPPAWMEHFVPGFVSWTSVVRSHPEDPDPSESAQLRIVVDHPLDEGYIREIADSVKTLLEARGHAVSRITVPAPGRHPHADQMDAFLYLLAAFGVLSFLLSAATARA
jgi:putative ABC transport system permease protein